MALVWTTVVLLHVIAVVLFLVPTSATTTGLRYPVVREFQPRRRTSAGCRLRKYLDHEVVVAGCRPQFIPITGCFGQCHSYELPILQPPHKLSQHKMCSYGDVEWRTVELQDCEPGVNRTYTYSYYNAIKCQCRRCDPYNTYCAGF